METVIHWLGILMLFLAGITIGTAVGASRKNVVPKRELLSGSGIALLGLVVLGDFHIAIAMTLGVGAILLQLLAAGAHVRSMQPPS